MIVLCAPEPELKALDIQHALDLSCDLVLAPWRLPSQTPTWGTIARFVHARKQVGENLRGLPGYPLAELAIRAWARGQTPRMLGGRFALRRALSHWFARCASRLDSTNVIIAPSLAARRVFASRPRSHKILWLDFPCLRQLHYDLNEHAKRHPESRYLHRYRAPDHVVIDQEVEWELADAIVVRGAYAWECLLRSGVPEEKLIKLKPRQSFAPPMEQGTMRSPSGYIHIALAGIAGARHGGYELLKLLDSRPCLVAHLRFGEGSEPSALAQHPQVLPISDSSWEQIDALVALSCCEGYFSEIARAQALGLPIIGTREALAWAKADRIVDLNDSETLARAVDSLRLGQLSDKGSEALRRIG
jgi:hypothetical protein